VRGPLPHDWVLERVAAMVHHGGAGTMARVARAGIPSLPVPSAADGAFWARRARMLRISPPAIAPGAGRRELERTLERLVRSPVLRSRAEALGRELRREGGAGPAADLIDRIARRPRGR